MGMPARRIRLQSKTRRHSKDYADVFRGDSDRPNISRDRVKACLFQDRFEALIEPPSDNLSVTSAVEVAPSTTDVESAASNVDGLSQRLRLLQVVGSEAITIREALSVCRKIASQVGQSAGSFEQTLGMQFHF